MTLPKNIPLTLLVTALAIAPVFAGENTRRLTEPMGNETEGNAFTFVDPALLGFGSTGFTLSVTGSGALDYDESSKKSGSLNYYDLSLQVPFYGKDLGNGSFFSAKLAYGLASFEASNVLGLDQQTLHSASLDLALFHFPTTSEGWMGILILNPGLASDLNNFGSDAFTFTSVAVVGYQLNPRLTLAASAAYSHSIGEDTVFPGIGIIWRPTDTITLQLLPPIVALGWTPVPDWTFSLNAYPGGGSWAVDQQGKDRKVEAISLELWRVGVGVEHRIGKHWRVTSVVGANLGGKFELRDDQQRVLADRDLKPSAFGLLGVAWDF